MQPESLARWRSSPAFLLFRVNEFAQVLIDQLRFFVNDPVAALWNAPDL
jgi:hypothetical protein